MNFMTLYAMKSLRANNVCVYIKWVLYIFFSRSLFLTSHFHPFLMHNFYFLNVFPILTVTNNISYNSDKVIMLRVTLSVRFINHSESHSLAVCVRAKVHIKINFMEDESSTINIELTHINAHIQNSVIYNFYVCQQRV